MNTSGETNEQREQRLKREAEEASRRQQAPQVPRPSAPPTPASPSSTSSGETTGRDELVQRPPGDLRTREQIAQEAERSRAADASQRVSDASLLSRQRTTLRDQHVMAAFQATDPISSPKLKDLDNFSYEPAQADVATVAQIDAIQRYATEAGVPNASIAYAMWDIARYCADAGSSEFTEFVGTSTYAGQVSRAEIAAIIKRVTTMRRFCAFYAKIVWNIMLHSGIPPSDWMKKGYRENTKFAAFDFFHGVTNNAAMEPSDGLVRKPFHEEIVANQANKGTAIYRQEASKDKTASTMHEITGGRTGPRARLCLRGSSG